jgi:hypothetical protein
MIRAAVHRDQHHTHTIPPLGPNNSARWDSDEPLTVAAADRHTRRDVEAVGGMGGAALAPPMYKK